MKTTRPPSMIIKSSMVSPNIFLAMFAAVLGIVSASGPHKYPAIPPTVHIATPIFTDVYDATLLFTPNVIQDFVPGPFGDRSFVGFLGGNLTDSKTGALVGRILPGVGGEFGLISNVNGKFYTDVSVIIQWKDDHKFAFLKGQGIGSLGNFSSSTFYARMETDSTSRQHLANRALLLSIVVLPPTASPPNSTLAFFKLSMKSNPDGTFSG
ncbi:hypothetical protein D9757_010380 [Collybiopsis confluens]|uniref:Dirigent protein n=1 Tax=Collybiopsis confluens TaxID=2823264 RepID=A0A8H5LVZ1_9AGAR|nr:hypothetical protein D9757_010380 [Collybiopsis confluens]